MSQLDSGGDLITVNSFSQLPFIRTNPADASTPHNPSGLRLFGFDFPHPQPKHTAGTDDNKDTIMNTTTKTSTAVSDVGRKFECHYCCRNFPTSQALGGHQNAHKRERQHAKRAQFHSAAMAAHHNQATGSHVYSFLSYHSLSSAPTHHQHRPWSTPIASSAAARFYGGLGSVSQPMNGNPLPDMQWRVHRPSMQHDRTTAMMMMMTPTGRDVAGGASCFSSSTSVVDLDGYESADKNSVSLDLHL